MYTKQGKKIIKQIYLTYVREIESWFLINVEDKKQIFKDICRKSGVSFDMSELQPYFFK